MDTQAPPQLALRSYQHDGSIWLTQRTRSILGDAPGVGKTATALCALDEERHPRVIVVAPLSVCRHWESEVTKWRPQWRPFVAIGSAAARKKVIAAAQDATAGEGTEPFGRVILITNYETVRGKDLELLLAFSPNAVLLDEAHRVKDRRTKTFAAIKDLTWSVPKVICITGTPILNRVEELWSLLNLCDPKRWSAYWKFVDTYCDTEIVQYKSSPQPTKIVRGMLPGVDIVLRQELRDIMIRRESADVLPELPDITVVEHEIDLSPPERKYYDQMAKFYFTSIEEEDGNLKQVVAPNDVARITRLRQLSCDASVFDPDLGVSSKLKALAELVDDIGEPVVVFSTFSKVIDRVAAVLDQPVGRITGDVPGPERQAVIEAFAAGNIRVIAGTIRAMGEGIDKLQLACRRVIFLDQDWTPSWNEQAVARVRRMGQTEPVFVHQLVARETIDQYVAKVLRAKQDVFDTLVGRNYVDLKKVAKGEL